MPGPEGPAPTTPARRRSTGPASGLLLSALNEARTAMPCTGDVQVLARRLQISRWGHQAVIRDASWLRWIAGKSNPIPTFPGYSHIQSRRILKNQPLQERVGLCVDRKI